MVESVRVKVIGSYDSIFQDFFIIQAHCVGVAGTEGRRCEERFLRRSNPVLDLSVYFAPLLLRAKHALHKQISPRLDCFVAKSAPRNYDPPFLPPLSMIQCCCCTIL